MRHLLFSILAFGAALVAGPVLAGDPYAEDHPAEDHPHGAATETVPDAAPPPQPEPEPERKPKPAEITRQRARDIALPGEAGAEGSAPASRTALDRARRNAGEGVPPSPRDRGLDTLSNEDLNQVLIGPHGQKVIIRDYDAGGGQTSRSVTILDSEVTSTRGQGSRACSSVGAIGDTPGCQ
jgi:hypothetical protein